MPTVFHDFRYGFRVLRSSPAFTAIAVLTLALGIAANTTVFSWIDAVLLRPLPGVADPGRVVAFETVAPNGEPLTTSYPDFRDFRDHLQLSSITVAQPNGFSVGEEDRVERVWGQLVSGNFFEVLGVKATLGRTFSPDERGDKPGGYPVAVISDRLWRSRFHADTSVIGRNIRVNRHDLTIIGVAAPEFRGTMPGLSFEIWIPYVMAQQLNGVPDWMIRDRKTRNMIGLVRLNSGVGLEQANAEASSLAAQLARMDPYTNGGIGAALLPVWKAHFGAQAALLAPLQILMAVCGVVLLIVCANVANLLLARATSRRKEFSIRVALGAGRGRLGRQVLVETLVLALTAAIVGVPLAMWMAQALGFLLPPTSFPIILDVRLSTGVLLFTILLSIAAAVISGVAPAIQSARADVNENLKEGGRSATPGTRSNRMRGLLVASEVALALVALIGAGLFARSFQTARAIHPGFSTDRILMSRFYLPSSGYSVEDRKQFCRLLRERLETAPGVTGVAYGDTAPLGFEPSWWEDLQVEGYLPRTSENMKIYRAVVAPGYFRLLRIPLLDGRDFTDLDDEKSEQVMIVNETFVKRFFAGRYPIGRHVRGWGRWFTIVGVARDAKYNHIAEGPTPYFYVPFRQVYRGDMNVAFFVRTAGDPRQAISAVRRTVRSIDPGLGVFDAIPLVDYIGASLFAQKVAASLLAALGALALVLAGVGLYSVMAYSVAQRTHEMGIRMALGAQPRDVRWMVLGQGMVLTLAGLAVGALVSLAVTRVAAGLLVGTSATDPLVFAGAAVFLATIGALASYLPARRATRTDPVVALRYQ